MTDARGQPVRTGRWAAERYGVLLRNGYSPLGLPVGDLLGIGLRRNPSRPQLLVSTVLGKHVPTDPRLVWAAGRLLGLLVADTLSTSAARSGQSHPGKPDDPSSRADRTELGRLLRSAIRTTPGSAAALLAAVGEHPAGGKGVVVLGYAETATGLGHAVADALPDCYYLHSTRRAVPGVRTVAGFEEEHSHARSHLVLPEDPGALAGSGPLVLVDDELSTGRTVRNTILALHGLAARSRYVVATLADLRSAADRAALDRLASRLGTRIDVVALACGQFDAAGLTAGNVGGVGRACTEPDIETPTVAAGSADVRRGRAERIELTGMWPRGLRDGGRHGYRRSDRDALHRRLPGLVEQLAAVVAGARVLVLGTEELMYVPLRLAVALAQATGTDVGYSTTTRSPAIAVDDPGYPLRTALTFETPDGPRFAYNVAPGAGARRFGTIVVVTDDAAPALMDLLDGYCDRLVVVPVPSYRPGPLPPPLRGPPAEALTSAAVARPSQFGSYAAEEIGWLLSDLSGRQIEAPTEEREEAIQSGGRHYAESLPVEYVPTAQYRQLFDKALAASAARVAAAVGVVSELVLARRGPEAVLVSLARAGTPIGILMRRWARFAHGIDVPHYAVSIVRGRGIDPVALRWLAAHHHPQQVMFVDGWTGKGAIVRELHAALDVHATTTGARFSGELAVLADPGHCVAVYGTREDFLVPSACLNSTVSGLISRTVLNDHLIAPGDFHGAKFYADLAGVDVSATFLDHISGQFDSVADEVGAALRQERPGPTWRGWAAIQRISVDYGIDDVNLVKPGVGETTRVLLRRVPWRILARTGAGEDIEHVLLLAAERGVPVEYVERLPYSCVGLIHPRFTRGASGSDGTSAAASVETGAPMQSIPR